MLIPKISAASFRVMSFSIDHIPSNLSRLSSCFQNHMNTLAAETASAWYLILNRKRPPKRAVASYFNMTQFSSHLPRNPDDGDIPGLRWRGCHNSAASFYSCAAGFRLKSVGGCEQVSLSPHGVLALEVPPPGLRLALIAGNSLIHHLLGCPSWRRA